jgi:hypothetical protein
MKISNGTIYTFDRLRTAVKIFGKWLDNKEEIEEELGKLNERN